MTKHFLMNASLQMVVEDCSVKVEHIDNIPHDIELVSAIGHADTAACLGVECNRTNVVLKKGDIAFVAQLIGGRLPEGTTTLPEGFKFKFVKITIQ